MHGCTIIAAAIAVALAGCESGADDATCYFPSGRPCHLGEVCLGRQLDECNYYSACNDGGLAGTAIACTHEPIEPVAGGPFLCDPSLIPRNSTRDFTPPPAPCPLGSLWALDPERELPYIQCVPVAQCEPIRCDPAFAGDGCPSNHECDAVTYTCIAAP
ncbi:MAG TPA: hypothetical protein VM513_17630 [Kofleriaceae bacterium]|nr:hypothetical protein [Kofleriaceae bacterium]